MPYVSLIVEAIRARPAGVCLLVILAQGLLWVLVPALFYASPPGNLPELLAIGHEWQLGSRFGPPLAFWLAEAAFNAAGGRIIGVYILSQLCVGVSLWAIFRLGRTILGAQHAALAVLLMGGILALSMPTPEFAPAVLAMPLAALALMHFWQAVGEGRRGAWVALAFETGLLLLTTYWGLLLFALFALFLLLTREGRVALATIDPWMAGVLTLLVPFPHWAWLQQNGIVERLTALVPSAPDLLGRLAFWPLQLIGLLALHVGLIALVLVVSPWRADRRVPMPEIVGPKRRPQAERFVLFFGVALPVTGTLAASLLDVGGSAIWAAPLVLLSGLAVVMLGGPSIVLYRQRVAGLVWLGLLLLPPFGLVAALIVTPWTGGWIEWDTEAPAASMGRFFTDTYRRRIGRPLEVVVGDARVAYVVALSSPDRPRVYAPADPARTPWLSEGEVKAKGAIAVWDLQQQSALPPPAIRDRFPDLVAEVPQRFERPMPGLLPALRIGWGLLRPPTQAAAMAKPVAGQ